MGRTGGPPDTEKLLESWRGGTEPLDCENHSIRSKERSRLTFVPNYSSIILALLLVVTNIGWWESYHRATSKVDRRGSPQELTYFLGPDEPEHTMMTFEHDWEDLQLVERNGYRYGDIHWANNTWVPTHGGSVSLPSTFIATHNLFPGAAPLASNSSESHYVVAAYHQMHCLSEIRDSIYFLNGSLAAWPRPEPFQWDHILHCVEAVRQALACAADPTLVPVTDFWPGLPNGQPHVCRNSEALFAWTERHAYPYPEFGERREPPRTEEWRERTKGLGLGRWSGHTG